MKISITKNEELKSISMKLPISIKKEIDKISKKEKVNTSELIRSFLNYSIDQYHQGNVIRVGDENFMKRFRKMLKVGDKVIASGIVGKIEKVKDSLITLEVAKGVLIEVVKDEVTDVLDAKKDRNWPHLAKF